MSLNENDRFENFENSKYFSKENSKFFFSSFFFCFVFVRTIDESNWTFLFFVIVRANTKCVDGKKIINFLSFISSWWKTIRNNWTMNHRRKIGVSFIESRFLFLRIRSEFFRHYVLCHWSSLFKFTFISGFRRSLCLWKFTKWRRNSTKIIRNKNFIEQKTIENLRCSIVRRTFVQYVERRWKFLYNQCRIGVDLCRKENRKKNRKKTRKTSKVLRFFRTFRFHVEIVHCILNNCHQLWFVLSVELVEKFTFENVHWKRRRKTSNFRF